MLRGCYCGFHFSARPGEEGHAHERGNADERRHPIKGEGMQGVGMIMGKMKQQIR